MSKKVKRVDKEFQELVDEMVADLVLQDMDAAGEVARRKAEEEHQVSLRRYIHIPVLGTQRNKRTKEREAPTVR